MPVTLTDEQMAQLRTELESGKRARGVEDMVNGIWNDPQLSAEAKSLFKRKYPDVPIPDFDIEQKVNARFDAEKAERDAERKKKRDDEQDAHNASEKKRVQDEYSFTDDGMKEVEDFMLKNNVGSYEVAASYLASKRPKPTDDLGYDNHLWRHQDQDNFKAISDDPEGYARKEILRAARADQARQRQMT